MIKSFLFIVISVAGLCTAASAAVVDYSDYNKNTHNDGKFDNGYYYSNNSHNYDGNHNFSWDDRRYDHDKGDHHGDHDFRWWLVASSSDFDSHDHWWFDDHGNYRHHGDPGGISAVPLPSALSMFGGAFLLLGALSWRRRAARS